MDPETAGLRRASAPIPRTAIVCEEAPAVKVRAKSRRDLDNRRLLAKNTLPGRGNGSS
jgi:hypothetical protein